MFLGHLAVGFAAKRHAPRVSLGVLIAACQFLDILWPVFLALGIERAAIVPGITETTPLDLFDYPWSHSLLFSILWSALFFAIGLKVYKDRAVGLVLAAVVFSHFILDFVTHRPDMPLTPWTELKVGLGLWNHRTATVIIELAMFAAGVWIYVKETGRPKPGLLFLLAFLLAAYAAAIFGPPPPSMTAVTIGSMAGWLLLIWAHFADRRNAD